MGAPAVELSRAELEARLREAEETLRAIHEGEVDALVVRAPDAEQVFTLEGSTESYRAFMEAVELGVAAFDAEGRLLYANQALGTLLQLPGAGVQHDELFARLDRVSQATLRRLLLQAAAGRQSAELSLAIDGEIRNLLLTAAPLPIGVIRGVAVTFTDITERERSAIEQESQRLANAVLASASQAVIVCDRAGRVTHVNAAGQRICSDEPVGKPFGDVISLVFPSGSELMTSEDIVLMAIAGTPVQGLEAAVTTPAMVTDLLVSAAPLIVSGDRVQGCVVTLVDLSQRKAAERQQALLMGELDHRVRNTLGMVLAISARTAANETTIEGFQKAFAGRVQALAATHTLLAKSSWENLQIADILRAELAPYTGATSRRITISGLDISVDARTAVSLGLIFHELTTNAVKYGALSTMQGRLAVTQTGVSDAGALLIEWRESEGPMVTEPTRSGFGQTVISRSLATGPGGGATLHFDPEGLVCRLAVPRDGLAAA
jgi:PAS domain S-box-containing protein